MDAGHFEKMLGAITGFEMRITAWRGTAKLGQNKPDKARIAAADALDALGQRSVAHLMRTLLR
jgi:transcriptional regulator